jgi:peptidoglycan/LPS O-acetylase OafA/YrhL
LISASEVQPSEIVTNPGFHARVGGRLRELDGWRAVSVMLVILHHFGFYQHGRLVARLPGLSHLYYYCGPLGVKVFFVISGFVICRLLMSEEMRYGSVSLRGFYYRRVFRIVPPLLVYLGTVFLLWSLGLIQECRRAILDSGLFLFDFKFPPHSWIVGHTWSLAVEEQFYLIFPATWILTPKRWRGPVFLGIFIFCVAFYLSAAHAGQDGLFFADTRPGFACISFGVLMAIHEWRVRSITACVPAFVAMLVAVLLLVHPAGEGTWSAALYEGLFVPPAIGLVLLSSLEHRSWLRSLLCSKLVQAVGLTSYGIYLWQELFTAPKRFYVGDGEIIPLLLPLMCVIVPLSYFLIEKPAMRFGKSLSQRARLSREPAV